MAPVHQRYHEVRLCKSWSCPIVTRRSRLLIDQGNYTTSEQTLSEGLALNRKSVFGYVLVWHKMPTEDGRAERR